MIAQTEMLLSSADAPQSDGPIMSGGSGRLLGRVLVACEYSGAVRDAFAARGWDAWSCDLLPSEKPGQHYVGDVRHLLDVLNGGWDIEIAKTKLTCAMAWVMMRSCDTHQ
jgi:hypothetical protein